MHNYMCIKKREANNKKKGIHFEVVLVVFCIDVMCVLCFVTSRFEYSYTIFYFKGVFFQKLLFIPFFYIFSFFYDYLTP